MTDFDLGRRFDAVICLFSSIGYTRTTAGLNGSPRRRWRATSSRAAC